MRRGNRNFQMKLKANAAQQCNLLPMKSLIEFAFGIFRRKVKKKFIGERGERRRTRQTSSTFILRTFISCNKLLNFCFCSVHFHRFSTFTLTSRSKAIDQSTSFAQVQLSLVLLPVGFMRPFSLDKSFSLSK